MSAPHSRYPAAVDPEPSFRCPRCGMAWPTGGPCPQCGAKLERHTGRHGDGPLFTPLGPVEPRSDRIDMVALAVGAIPGAEPSPRRRRGMVALAAVLAVVAGGLIGVVVGVHGEDPGPWPRPPAVHGGASDLTIPALGATVTLPGVYADDASVASRLLAQLGGAGSGFRTEVSARSATDTVVAVSAAESDPSGAASDAARSVAALDGSTSGGVTVHVAPMRSVSLHGAAALVVDLTYTDATGATTALQRDLFTGSGGRLVVVAIAAPPQRSADLDALERALAGS